MADFVLSCCSTADLTKEHFQQRDISYICFHYQLDGVDYPDDLGESMPFDKFYAAMANGADTRTSQVNISEFVDYFTPFLEQGKDILHVCLSSGLSGVSNSAENAARIVRERYPERKIYIVDSLGASSGYGLLMDKLADLRDEGMSIDAVRDWAEAHKLELHHWFFSTDLTFYVKGGRISKVAGVFGGLLDICPLLNMDNLGRLIPRAKIRGKKRVMKEIVMRMEELAVRVLSGGAERASGSAAGGNARPKAPRYGAASEKREWNREKTSPLMPDGMGALFLSQIRLSKESEYETVQHHVHAEGRVRADRARQGTHVRLRPDGV